MSETAPASITLNGLGGLHIQVDRVYEDAGDRILISLVKKARKCRGSVVGFNTYVLTAVGAPSELPRLRRDCLDIAQIALAGVFFYVPDASAIKAAEFLGVTFDQRTTDERHSP